MESWARVQILCWQAYRSEHRSLHSFNDDLGNLHHGVIVGTELPLYVK